MKLFLRYIVLMNMAKKGISTEASPMSWDDFQNLTGRMSFDGEQKISSKLKREQHYKFLLLISFGCYFGLRIGDLLKLKWVDVYEKSQISIKEQKTQKLREITVNKTLAKLIKRYKQELNVTDLDTYIFTNNTGAKILSIQYINRQLKAIFKEYKIKVKNPSSHTLRKSFGLRVFEINYKSDEALITLSHIFNHSNTSITRRYIGLEAEKIKDVYLSL